MYTFFFFYLIGIKYITIAMFMQLIDVQQLFNGNFATLYRSFLKLFY